MRKNCKKGFTIVELVIVIAVIGILTAVLVPTFSSLISKAHQSADSLTIRNINTTLASSNKNFNTLDEVKAYLEDEGFSKNVNATTAGNYFVWDRNANQFLIAKNSGASAVGVYPEKYEGKTPQDGEWYRFAEVVINVSAQDLENYTVQVFQPTLRLTEDASEKVVISGIANVDLTGHTLSAGLELSSNEKGGFYIDYGTVAGSDFEINTPNATFIHSKNLVVNVATSTISVAEHSYYLYGKIITNKLKLEGVTHMVLEPDSTFEPIEMEVMTTANPSITTIVGSQSKTLTKEEFGFTGSSTEVSGNVVKEKIEKETKKIEPRVIGTEVINEAGLRQALENGGNIILLDNITTATTQYVAKKPFKLYGNNFKITVQSSASGQRVIDMDAEKYPELNGGEFLFKDVKLLLTDEASNTRVVSTYALQNSKLTFDNVEMGKAFYALNLPSKTNNLEILIKNSHIKGWAAVNSYTSNSTITIIDTVLEGINDKSYNADGWNNFATLVIDGGSLYNVKNASRNVVLNVINSTIITEEVENANGQRNSQGIVSLQYSAGHDDIYCTNCTFISRVRDKDGKVTETTGLDDSKIWPCDYTHRIYLNGEKIFGN